MEFQNLAEELQDELLAHAKLLQEFGPRLGRPTVDTLKGSKHANMKELRFGWKRTVWRVAFAFDPRRQAILLAGGDKSGYTCGRGGTVMKTIETTITVLPDGSIHIPPRLDLPTGEHRAVLVVDQNGDTSKSSTRQRINIPIDDVGPWPEKLTLRREDMYDDDGR